MPFDTDLQAAGRRAALQPVPTPPPLAALQERADKQKTKRRVIGSGMAALAVVAVSLPLALSMQNSTTVQSVVAGTGDIAPAAQVESPEPPTDPAPAAANSQDDSENGEAGEAGESDIRIELNAGQSHGDFSLSIKVLTGPEAASAGAEAAAAATETLDVDGLAIWVSGNGDQRTVAALIEPDEYVEVTGNADQLDRLIDILRNGGIDGPGISGFTGPDFDEFFGENFDPFGENGFGEFDGKGFEFFFDPENGEFPDFEQFFGENGEFPQLDEFFEGRFENGEFPDFEQFFGENGEFPDLEQFFQDNFENGEFPNFENGEFPNFEQFFQGNFENGEFPNFEQFFGEEGFALPFGSFGDSFDGCVSIEGDDNGESFSFEFPEGCSSTG